MTTSPLFPHTFTDTAKLISIIYVDPSPDDEGLGPPRNRLRIVPVDVVPEIPVASVDEAEDVVLTKGIDGIIRINFDTNPENHIEDSKGHMTALPLLLCHAANIVASKCRRGAGNVALMHPDLVPYLGTAPGVEISDGSDGIGRWRNVGKVNRDLTVMVSEGCPREAAYVVYVSGAEAYADGPAVLFDQTDGLHLKLSDSAADYIERINIMW